MIKLKPRTRIILLSVISILIVVTIVLGVTYSFMQANIDSSSVTEVSLSSCAKITLSDTGASINLNNTNPISKNKALQTTPYTFTVTSSCESYVGFNLYLATLNTNTLVDSSVHYIITRNGSKDILAEGILSEATNALSEFTSDDQNQLNVGINGTFATIYKLYNDDIPLQGEVSYDLYLYIDSEVTDASTMGKTFNAGIAVKSYDREADPATFADYIINEVYTGTDGENDLYFHDGIGSYINADQEAGDNSYRYSGANPNNYVCFGSDEATCPNDNLYRIIGVFGNQIKLIKYDYVTREMLGQDGDYLGNYDSFESNYKGVMNKVPAYDWNGENQDITFEKTENYNIWSYSALNTVNLNTNFISALGSEWSDLIATTNWQVGGGTSDNLEYSNAQTAYNYEVGANTANTTYGAKIGLMYVSDYGYAVSPEMWNTNMGSLGTDTNRSNNWMFMGLYEWTISRVSDSTDYTLLVSTEGNVLGYYSYGYSYGYVTRVRPCFYLKSSVVYTGGTGTQTDPYRIV